MKPKIDPLFRIEVLRKTPNPQQAIWFAMHQDYCENLVFEEIEKGVFPDESIAGEYVVKNLLQGGRGHWGPLEHVHIMFNVGYFPHSAVQQLDRHRLLSFDEQSMRYTGLRIRKAYDEIELLDLSREPDRETIERLFYIRPVGEWVNRQGKHYTVTTEQRTEDIKDAWQAIKKYRNRIVVDNYSEEHARSSLLFDYRQHFVFSGNLRSILHLLDIRAKKDAQQECQWFCDLLFPHIEEWCPEIAAWYSKNRAKKARLAP